MDVQKNAWISDTIWRLVDERVSMCQEPARYRYLICRLGRDIVTSLKGDRRRREEEASKEVEKLLGSEPPLHWESWHQMKGWHWDAVYRALPPAQVTLERITPERVDLYSYLPPPGDNTPVSVGPFPVDELVPTEDEIKWVVA